jgi:hypothetical protein
LTKERIIAEEGSSLILFSIRPEITKDHVDNFIREVSSRKKASQQSLYRHGKHIEEIINKKNKEGKSWAQKQVYIALDILKAAASQLNAGVKIVESPDTEKIDQAAGIAGTGFTTVVAVIINPDREAANSARTLFFYQLWLSIKDYIKP